MKIAIIGAGLGGLSAAALLSKRGHQVDIFERESTPGGRAVSLDGDTLTLDNYNEILRGFNVTIPLSEPSLEEIFDQGMLNGYRIDLGFHLIAWSTKSTITRVLKTLGEPIEFTSSRFRLIHPTRGVVHATGSPFTLAEKIRMPLDVLRQARALTLASKLSALEKVPIIDVIDGYGIGRWKLAWETYPRLIVTLNDLAKISAGQTLRVVKSLLGGGRTTGYPIGGLATLSNAFSNVIHRYGGRICLGCEVEEIVIEEGAARGIVVDGEMREYESVVSSIMVQDLFSIASEREFPSDYVKRVKGLEGTGSLCAYYVFKELKSDLIGRTFAFLERDADVEGEDAAGIIDFQTANPKVGLSPKGRYLVQSYIICTPEEARNMRKVERLREVLDQKLETLIPNFREKMMLAIYPTTWHLDGVAKTVDCEKPGQRTPIANLYLVGDCTRSTGVGMNCTVDSALNLLKMVDLGSDRLIKGL